MPRSLPQRRNLKNRDELPNGIMTGLLVAPGTTDHTGAARFVALSSA
jgi:hypothetical protein